MEQIPGLTIHGITIFPIKRSQSSSPIRQNLKLTRYNDKIDHRAIDKEWHTFQPIQMTRRFLF